MAIIRCKMCGGDLLLSEVATTARCEYCGSLQTVPVVDQEKKGNLFTRANRLRFGCEFDKAYGVYETIVGEYPEEPEAYWGLVLCKYGIEYVDDPITARKIPTCHRSSFESVLEDSNYEMALEYADVEARKLYRQEAKTIETIRKGIQEISAREAPYDIFICYKETGLTSSQRTLDSVLAQDLYDTLTHKGYRVFFSRVTLEDKVGQEYEPYIFAALNSAKIMLVVGTDYEHFNAVWVKNEWRRYLMLMAEDREKHLIPCYKDIEIEDMPQEFRRLQAQDLGKVGAVQDLLRGIEKLLPLGSKGTVPKRKVDAAVAALLERGHIALEDRQWEDADQCFEKALQQDPQNAEGYIGKLLAYEHRKSLEALVEKWVEVYNDTESVTHTITEKSDYYQPEDLHPAALEFVNQEALEQLYQFSAEYTSEAESCQAQYRQGQQMWKENRYLVRAREYADEALAKQLQEAREGFLGELKDNLEKAKRNDQRKEQQLRQEYADNLEVANQKAAQLYREAEEALAQRYRQLCDHGESSVEPTTLKGIATDLEAMGNYEDCIRISRELREKAQKIAKDRERQKEIDKQHKRALDTQIYKAEMRKEWIKKILPFIVIPLLIMLFALLSRCENDEKNSYGYYTYSSLQMITEEANSQGTCIE